MDAVLKLSPNTYSIDISASYLKTPADQGILDRNVKYAYNVIGNTLSHKKHQGQNKMLQVITEITDELKRLVQDDPVRPELPAEFRINDNSRVFVLKNEEGDTLAVTCVKFLSKIPESVEDLTDVTVNTSTAVFYTIWSYAAGAGRRLIQEAQQEIKNQKPEVSTYVTLSPKTEMARRFHHKNGAKTYRENTDTVNYLYD